MELDRARAPREKDINEGQTMIDRDADGERGR